MTEEWFHKIRIKGLPKDSKISKIIKTNSNQWLITKYKWLESKSIKDQKPKEVKVGPEVDLVVVAPGAQVTEEEMEADLEPIIEACLQI